MKNKLYYGIFLSLLALCAVVTAVHVIYLFNAYPDSSIIHFIAKERW